MQLNEEHIYDCQRHPLLPTQWKPAAERIFDFRKYPAEPNWDAYDRHMDNAVREICQELAKKARQRVADFARKKEEPTMQVSYNGFTGELVKLETKMVDGLFYTSANTYLVIYDSEKQVTHSFTGVKLEDVKFLGGAVSFGE